MAGLAHAIAGLEQALDKPRRHEMWRWLVRHRVARVHEALAGEQAGVADVWLAPRQTALVRERDALLRKLQWLSGEVAESPDVEPVRGELRRLLGDLERHRQKINDLVYDGVAVEIGGSE